ncbi:MAG TPA: hypothetical protein ENK98_09990, partial [Epsilonproteobacteria bacterium]|nr:hypothetical protein [Campylobacterota bacterium]
MKRNTIYAFLVSLALMFSGCGSNDKVDYTLKDVNNSVIEAKPGKFTVTNLAFKTLIPFVKSAYTDVAVELSNFKFQAAGCVINSIDYAPNPLLLDGSKGSQKTLTISGTVASDCNATAYTLMGDQKISLGKEEETSTGLLLLSTSLDENGNPGSATTPTTPVVDGNYSFYNIPPVITIDKAATTTSFAIQVIDRKLKGVPGMPVTITAYDTAYGKIQPQAVTTDADGYANFNYT